MLERIGEPVLLWNAFPLHPHEASNPLSNRAHTRAEPDATWPLTAALIAMVRPQRIVAIGLDAVDALAAGRAAPEPGRAEGIRRGHREDLRHTQQLILSDFAALQTSAVNSRPSCLRGQRAMPSSHRTPPLPPASSRRFRLREAMPSPAPQAPRSGCEGRQYPRAFRQQREARL